MASVLDESRDWKLLVFYYDPDESRLFVVVPGSTSNGNVSLIVGCAKSWGSM
jgi:hypothetical protein